MPDPHDLQRFLDAQAPVLDEVLAELRRGQKESHWMWFVFPQLRGLGSSPTARRYALASRDEALAFLAHPVLGPRLRECTRLALAHAARGATAVFGYPDDLKLRSCLTLFAAVAPGELLFREALDAFFDGAPDQATLAKL